MQVGSAGWVMYGSPVPKDLNLPAAQPQPTRTPPQMSSPGLLRYRSAPSTLLGEVMCGDHDFPGAAAGAAGHGPEHAAADNVLARFLAGHHAEIPDCKPPRPAAAAHFMEDAASVAASQQQQLMYPSQQQMAAMEGLYRNVSSGGAEQAVAAGASGGAVLRQSSSPAGFLNHLSMDNGNWCFCLLLRPPPYLVLVSPEVVAFQSWARRLAFRFCN